MSDELNDSIEALPKIYFELIAGLCLEHPNINLLRLIQEHCIDLTCEIPLIKMPLFHFIVQRKTEYAAALLEDIITFGLIEPNFINSKDRNSFAPIHYSIRSENEYAFDILLEAGVDLFVCDSFGNTPLHTAVIGFNSTYVELLMKKGAPASARNSEGYTPLDIAINNGLTDISRMINNYREISCSDIQIYKIHDVDQKIRDLGEDEASSAYGKSVIRLYEGSPYRERMMLKEVMIHKIKALDVKFPNFKDAISHITSELSLMAICDDSYVQFRPLLMHGAPGSGKSRFAKEVSAILCTPLAFIDGGSVSSAYSIAGINPSYKNSKQGRIAEFLINEKYANGICFLDEIDKLTSSTTDNQFAPLHSLLTPETSNAFKDEFIGVSLNASHLNWIATANDLNVIPDSILSRFEKFEILTPTKDEVKIIIDSILDDISNDPANQWARSFNLVIPDEVKNKLSAVPVRELKSIIMSGVSKAASDIILNGAKRSKKIELSETHFNTKKDIKPSIGFVQY